MPQDHHSCRHRPEARDDYDVVVGWDPPLNTYFAQVAQGARVEDVESWDLILWAGGEYFLQQCEQKKTVHFCVQIFFGNVHSLPVRP